MDIITQFIEQIPTNFKSYVLDISLVIVCAIGVLKLLGKNAIAYVFKKDLETYKSQLEEKATYLKTSLSIYAEEQNVAIKRVDAQTSNAIHTIYADIANVITTIAKLVTGCPVIDPTPEEEYQFFKANAEKAHYENLHLYDTLDTYAIYFTEKTFEQIFSFATVSSKEIAIFLKPMRLGTGQHHINEALPIVKTNLIKLEYIYKNSLSPMKSDIIVIFRELLRIEVTD